MHHHSLGRHGKFSTFSPAHTRTFRNENQSFLKLGAHFLPFVRLCLFPTLPHRHTVTHTNTNHTVAFHLQKMWRKKTLEKVMFVFVSVFFLIRIILCFGYFVVILCSSSFVPKMAAAYRHTYQPNARCSVGVCVFCSFHLFSCLPASLARHLFCALLLSESDSRCCLELPRRQNINLTNN